MERHIPGPAGKWNITEKILENSTITDGSEGSTASRIDGKAWSLMIQDMFPSETISDPTKIATHSESLNIISLIDVMDGTYDLRVPRMVVSITSLTPSTSGDWALQLQDKTASMEGFISAKHLNILEEHKQGFSVGCVVLLENVRGHALISTTLTDCCTTTVWYRWR